MKHILAKAAAFARAGALALSLAACGAKIDPVSLPGTLRLEKGETALLTPAYGASDATEEAVAKAAEKLTPAWSSSDEAVATVDENGLVTAVGAGRADITVTAKDGALTAVCPVTVEVPAGGGERPRGPGAGGERGEHRPAGREGGAGGRHRGDLRLCLQR